MTNHGAKAQGISQCIALSLLGQASVQSLELTFSQASENILEANR